MVETGMGSSDLLSWIHSFLRELPTPLCLPLLPVLSPSREGQAGAGNCVSPVSSLALPSS